MSETFEMVAKTLYGLEEILADELLTLGATDLQIGRRMVSFTGDKELLYKTNFHCRTALRILKPIYHFKAKDADTVYKEAKKVAWENYISLDNTFAIDSVIYSEDFNHSKFVAYRTKDAIMDYFIEKTGKRPSVRINHPDLYINIHISHNDCTLSIDSSGESLHKRGYRVGQTESSLNEVLAAGMILKTGWRGESNFVDPMCGSGTLLIEAAMIALNIAPGLHRKEFAFQKWIDYDEDMFYRIYNDDSQEREFNFKCYGSDSSPAAIDIALTNVRNAGLMKYIDLKVKPFQQYTETPGPGILVTNPPYSDRIPSRDLLNLYEMIGERLKHVFVGYQAWILGYKEEYLEKIGLRPNKKMKLMNGSMECEYRCYELFEGSNKDYKRLLIEKVKEERVDSLGHPVRYSEDVFNNTEEERPYSRWDRRDRPERRFDTYQEDKEERPRSYSDYWSNREREDRSRTRYRDGDNRRRDFGDHRREYGDRRRENRRSSFGKRDKYRRYEDYEED